METTQRALLLPGVELVEEIGRGGFAKVWRGRQLAVGRDVAVKIDDRVLDDDANRRRFVREATAVSRISGHPHVVSLIDVGVTRDNRPYLVMELCSNGSLASYLARHGPLGADEAVEVGLAVTSALAAAHEAGILHRDIKPGNILIDAWGTPRLSDFGLAALPQPGQDPSVTLEALTPAYASPEAFSFSPPTPQSDVFSMGATLHAMISGASPRRSADGGPVPIDQLLASLHAELPDPGVPGSEALMRVIRSATAYDATRRYPTARELHDALRAIRPAGASVGGVVVGGPEASFTQLRPLPAPAPRPAAGRRRWPFAVAAALVGLGLGGLGGFLLAPDPAPATPEDAQPRAGATGAAADPLAGAPDLGACYSGVQQLGQALSATKGSCADDNWFTFAVGQLDDTTTDVTTDAVEADAAAQSTCTAETLRGYDADTGGTRPKGEYDVFVLPPSSTAFLQGQRWFACLARLTSS
ncbi:serine/threonine-protein kinase [Nocardioides daeguensis]|uniref:serine/threonine-protein kinase n=1 Tax=Nocardioides daeguensis TaxID=908359 RepID=UPI001C43D379|nr:serine/threonine-protein kinase [Nocardioides daeguensis]MBV6729211.1 serine/threonine protein kinase [Nocardioides daeguensis]MCR1774778.1 serine/threonine protein kinase [Nocardioides daeguensis]